MKTIAIPIIFTLAIIAVILVPGCKMHFTPEPVTFKSGSTDISRGKHLTILTCGPCHYNRTTGQLSGKKMDDLPGIVGKVYAANITKDKEHGIGRYSDAELAYLLRTGVSREGKLMPYMQRPNMSDEDMGAIIAFLRSEDELVKPLAVTVGKTKYTLAGKMGISMSKPLPYPAHAIPAPPADKVSTGRYLADNFSCKDCHAKNILAVNITEPEKSKGYMGGGSGFKNKQGEKIRSANITFDETGIAGWTVDDFKKAVREGVGKNNDTLSYPMPKYKELSDEEATAIYEYLKTVPHIKNEVK